MKKALVLLMVLILVAGFAWATESGESEGNVLVICPETPLHCGTLTITTQRQQEIYDMGYKQGLESIDKVKEFIRY